MKSLIRFLVSLFMPIVLIAGGGTLAGWGINLPSQTVIYTGLALIGAGIIWGLFLFFWASGGDW